MKNKIRLSLLFIFYTSIAFAGKMEWVAYLDKADIIQGKTLSIADLNEYNLSSHVRIINVKVRLSYTREDQTDVQIPNGNGWAYMIKYNLEAKGTNNSIANGDLRLSFGEDYSYIYEQIKVDTIPNNLLDSMFQLTITDAPSSSGNVPNDIKLELILEVESYCEITWTQPTLESTYLNNNEQLQVYWPYLDCAEEYELEYAFIDSCTIIDNQQDFEDQLAYGLFNEVRINTSNQHYILDMHYPAGTLYLRLRGVGVFTQNVEEDYTHKRYSFWSDFVPVKVAVPFEPKKMWQVVSTFAEDGKFKKVNTFVDGSGRTRQVLTNLSSDSTIIIGETKYDDEGRAALSFMPVPQPGNALNYRPYFNRPLTSIGGYEKNHYRNLGQPAAQANPATGAAEYYSADTNSPTESIHKNYIPDAEDYPFSQTQYDGLGRPKFQSGVGPTHKIGDGHETKYFYVGANSTELRRLFGSNVGSSKHYSKDVVMDANGQISVAYKDLADRTIATALAGESPDNVIPLDYTNSPVLAVNFNEDNIIDETLGESYSQSPIMNLKSNSVYNFSYNFQGVINEIGLPYEVCPTCEYILEINITPPSDCLNPDVEDIDLTVTSSYKPEVSTYNSIRDTINAGQLEDCNDKFPLYAINFRTTFKEIGEYTINKTLKVSETSWDNFLQAIMESGALPDSSTMIQYFISQIDSTACEIVTSDDSLTQEIIDTIASIECQNLLETLKQEIRPGGAFYYTYDTTKYLFEKEDSLAMAINPDYCQYLHCLQLTDSRTYDTRAQLIKGWMEAGNLSNMQNEYNIDFTNPVATDPVFSSYMSSTDCDYKAQMQDYLQNNPFTFTANGIQMTILGLENFAHFLAKESSGNQANQLPVPYDELKWQFFRGFYQAKKIKLIQAFQANPDSACNPHGLCETPEPCPPPVIDNGVINVGEIIAGIYQANNDFTMSVPVHLFADVLVKAGKTVTLKPGFHVKKDTRFHALISPPELSLTDCDDDPRNSIFDIENQQDLLDWTSAMTNYVGLADCEGNCDTTVMAWMDVLNFSCDTLSTAQRKNDSLLIAQNLKAYCLSKCSDLNPFVFIKESEWETSHQSLNLVLDRDPHLFAIQNILSKYCSDSLYKEISLPEVCTIDTTSFTNHIIETTIDPCLNLMIDGMNSTIFQDCYHWQSTSIGNNISWAHIGVSNRACFPGYYQFTLDFAKNSSIEDEITAYIGNPPNPCTFITLYKEDGTKIPFTEISELFFPQYTVDLPAGLQQTMQGTTDLLTFKKLKSTVTDKDCNTFTVYFYSSCDIVFAEKTETYEEITSIDTTCLCQPPQIGLDVDDYYEECIDQLVAEARYNAIQNWNDTIADILTDLRQHYQCLPSFDTTQSAPQNDGFSENFKVAYTTKEYHYTLYYYDQAGNLVMTVPPESVFPATVDPDTDFTGPDSTIYIGPEPNHNYNLASTYQFNSWNQPIQQESPDGGATTFHYDDKGQLRLSQNAHQKANATEYSYSKYDEQGRPIEVGQVDDLNSFSIYDLNTAKFPSPGAFTLTEIVETTYDQDPSGAYVSDRNLRGRVAEVRRSDTENNPHSVLTYDYDPHGNVKRLLQKAAFLDPKEVTYDYDQISGNVNEVCFQPGRADQYAHRFAYDADNRLTDVWTSRDYVIWQHDARYFYYAHGPLARVELGEDIVQGLDYYYSIHGWLKGMNIPEVNGANDPGKDGYTAANNLNRWAGKDTVSFALGYYKGDYSPKNQTINLGAASTDKTYPNLSFNNYILGNTQQPGLFNGNIAWMITDIPENGSGSQMQAMAYKYDQLHRIKNANSFQVFNEEGWRGRFINDIKPYDANYSYDKNGNLQTLNRWGQNATKIDAFEYSYDTDPNNERKTNNQLQFVSDGVGDQGENDLDNQPSTNYDYDEIGNLTKDEQAHIANIDWYVDGKVKEITFDSGQVFQDSSAKLAIAFKYDGMGNRIQKILKKGPTQVDWVIHHYSRDPQGNILAVYEQTFEKVGIAPIIVDLALEMTCSKSSTPVETMNEFEVSLINLGPNSNFNAVVRTPKISGLAFDEADISGSELYVQFTESTNFIDWQISNVPIGQTVSFKIIYRDSGFNGEAGTQSAYVLSSTATDTNSTPGTPTGEDDEASCTTN